jgi:hypothetical protein
MYIQCCRFPTRNLIAIGFRIYLLGGRVLDTGTGLVDREDKDFSDVDMWGSGGGPDDLLSDVFAND